MMRALNFTLLILLAGMQYRLWVGPGSWAQIALLNREIETQREHNSHLIARNQMLGGEVLSLKSGNDAIEEHARNDLGMLKRGETFYLVVDQ
jgi:cell division protein FtsB